MHSGNSDFNYIFKKEESLWNNQVKPWEKCLRLHWQLPLSVVQALWQKSAHLSVRISLYELHTYNNITYALYSDGTAEAVSYSGSNKDFSTTTFAMPSVIYSKNLGKDYILDRSQFTVTKMQADGFSGIKARIFSLPNKLQVLFGGFRNTQIGCFGIATDNAYFSISPSAGGILLNRSGTEIVAYPTKPSLYYSSDFISIPSTVTRIGDFAFTGYKATSITIPSTVTYVGNAAFEYSSLHKVKL